MGMGFTDIQWKFDTSCFPGVYSSGHILKTWRSLLSYTVECIADSVTWLSFFGSCLDLCQLMRGPVIFQDNLLHTPVVHSAGLVFTPGWTHFVGVLCEKTLKHVSLSILFFWSSSKVFRSFINSRLVILDTYSGLREPCNSIVTFGNDVISGDHFHLIVNNVNAGSRQTLRDFPAGLF